MTSKTKHTKKNNQSCQINIIIERDQVLTTTSPRGLYTVRVISHRKPLLPLQTGIWDFASAMRRAWALKEQVERLRHQRLPASCIKVIEGVELLMEQDATLKDFIEDGSLKPIRTIVKAKTH